MIEKKRVFIIDDDEVAMMSLKRLLVFSGYCAQTAEPTARIVRDVKFFRPDLILLDLIMPINGVEVCKMLCLDPSTAQIPIIIVSAFGSDKDFKSMLKKKTSAKIVASVGKPYEFSELLKVLAKWLPDRR